MIGSDVRRAMKSGVGTFALSIGQSFVTHGRRLTSRSPAPSIYREVLLRWLPALQHAAISAAAGMSLCRRARWRHLGIPEVVPQSSLPSVNLTPKLDNARNPQQKNANDGWGFYLKI